MKICRQNIVPLLTIFSFKTQHPFTKQLHLPLFSTIIHPIFLQEKF